MNKKLLPVIIVIIAAIGAFAVYYFFLRPEPETKEPTVYEELEDTVYYVPGDYFVTNITGSEALCKTSISLALSEDESNFLDTNIAVVRNAVVRVLIAHPEEEMRASNNIVMLEDEMTQSLRDALGLDEEVLKRVLISDFVIQ